MFSTFLSVTLFAAATIRGVVAADFTISTPTDVVQCQQIDLSWSGGQAPFNVIVVPSADPCADALQDLGDTDNTSQKWTPKLPAGEKVVLSLIDSTGAEAWSGEITVKPGDDSCVPKDLLSSASSSSSAAAASSTAASSSSVAVTGTTLTVSPSASRAASSSSSQAPVGPAGAIGNEPFQGSNGASQAGAPIILLGALTVIMAFVL